MVRRRRRTISAWESRTTPGVLSLRKIRDALDIPNDTLVAALIRFSPYRGVPVKDEAVQRLFWDLIATSPGSVEEREIRNKIFEMHAWIAEMAVRGWDVPDEQHSDLVQRANEAILIATRNYIPPGNFTALAWDHARYAAFKAYFEYRYKNVDDSTRRLLIKVGAYINRHDDGSGVLSGALPSEAEIAQALNLTPTEVTTALQLREYETVSSDASFGPERPRPDVEQPIGASMDMDLSKEMRNRVKEDLKDLPDPELAERIVLHHLVGALLNITPETAQQVIASATEKLREVFTRPESTPTDDRDSQPSRPPVSGEPAPSAQESAVAASETNSAANSSADSPASVPAETLDPPTNVQPEPQQGAAKEASAEERDGETATDADAAVPPADAHSPAEAEKRHPDRGPGDSGSSDAAPPPRSGPSNPYPKIELHVHLEGTIRPETLLEMASRNGVELPADNADALSEMYKYRDFGHFLQMWRTTTGVMRTEEDFRQAVIDYAKEAKSHGVVYVEFTFSPINRNKWDGIPYEAMFNGVADGITIAEEHYGVIMRAMPSLIWGEPPEGAEECARWAALYKDRGIVGLDLSGNELARGDVSQYDPAVAIARAAGLGIVPHAGEAGGIDAIWEVLRWNPDGLQHGIAAAGDPALMAELVARNIVLRVTPTSNVGTNVVANIEDHPLPQLLAAGVRCSISTDDPALFGTDLGKEYALAEQLGISPAAAYRAGVDGALCDAAVKQQLREIGEEAFRDSGDPELAVSPPELMEILAEGSSRDELLEQARRKGWRDTIVPALREAITSARLATGRSLPTPEELAEHLGMASAVSLHQGYQQLTGEGYLASSDELGTTVASPEHWTQATPPDNAPYIAHDNDFDHRAALDLPDKKRPRQSLGGPGFAGLHEGAVAFHHPPADDHQQVSADAETRTPSSASRQHTGSREPIPAPPGASVVPTNLDDARVEANGLKSSRDDVRDAAVLNAFSPESGASKGNSGDSASLRAQDLVLDLPRLERLRTERDELRAELETLGGAEVVSFDTRKIEQYLVSLLELRRTETGPPQELARGIELAENFLRIERLVADANTILRAERRPGVGPVESPGSHRFLDQLTISPAEFNDHSVTRQHEIAAAELAQHARVFADAEELAEYVQQHLIWNFDSLPEETVKAVKTAKDATGTDPLGYANVNAHLAAPHGESPNDDVARAEIPRINRAMSELRHSLMVVGAATLSESDIENPNSMVGQTKFVHGYLPAEIGINPSNRLQDFDLVHLLVPAGMRALYEEPFTGVKQVVLDHGFHYVVTRVVVDDGLVHQYGYVLPNDWGLQTDSPPLLPAATPDLPADPPSEPRHDAEAETRVDPKSTPDAPQTRDLPVEPLPEVVPGGIHVRDVTLAVAWAPREADTHQAAADRATSTDERQDVPARRGKGAMPPDPVAIKNALDIPLRRAQQLSDPLVAPASELKKQKSGRPNPWVLTRLGPGDAKHPETPGEGNTQRDVAAEQEPDAAGSARVVTAPEGDAAAVAEQEDRSPAQIEAERLFAEALQVLAVAVEQVDRDPNQAAAQQAYAEGLQRLAEAAEAVLRTLPGNKHFVGIPPIEPGELSGRAWNESPERYAWELRWIAERSARLGALAAFPAAALEAEKLMGLTNTSQSSVMMRQYRRRTPDQWSPLWKYQSLMAGSPEQPSGADTTSRATVIGGPIRALSLDEILQALYDSLIEPRPVMDLDRNRMAPPLLTVLERRVWLPIPAAGGSATTSR